MKKPAVADRKVCVADERFQRNIDKHADGTAFFIQKAINAYCHVSH